MAVPPGDIKLLWGRSGNLCAMCPQPISSTSGDSPTYHIGEQAHIAGQKPGSARHDPTLTEQQIDSYSNLILLCPTCHTKIDKSPEEYPAALLHVIKSTHEQNVIDKISTIHNPPCDPSIEDKTYLFLLDEAVRLARLPTWQNIGSWISVSHARMPESFYSGVVQLQITLETANWPGTDELLELYLIAFARSARAMIDCFLEHAEPDPGNPEILRAIRFYKLEYYAQDEYNRRLAQFNQWEDARNRFLAYTTALLNALAQHVRSRLDPHFFLRSGKFRYETDVGLDLSCRTICPELKEGNHPNNLDDVQKKLDEIKSSYTTG